MGDGVLAYFGYPIAHEDEAERAIRAGLEVVSAITHLEPHNGGEGPPLSVCVGIATGPVVVGDLIGEGASQESAVVGEPPNLAARLQTLAAGNQVAIGATTKNLAGRAFVLSEQRESAVKGFAEPVYNWAALHEPTVDRRFDAGREDLSPLVGRDEELKLRLRRWDKASRGEGQVVLLSDEAGIGKSRLIQGLRERLHGHDYTSLRYQCSPYHINSALFPIITQLERAAQFDRADGGATRLDKLRALLHRSSDDPRSAVPLIANLLSVPVEEESQTIVSAQEQKDRTLTELSRQPERLSVDNPGLLLFEDVHWVDPTTLELQDLFVNLVREQRVLAILTHRPEFQAAWVGEAHVASLTMKKLPAHNA